LQSVSACQSSSTSQSPSTSQRANTSQSANASQSLFDADLLYASWLFEEVNPSLISSESEDEQTNDNLTSVNLAEILGQLASSINLEKKCIFNIRRSNVWEGAV
jgi:hypothetical protein